MSETKWTKGKWKADGDYVIIEGGSVDLLPLESGWNEGRWEGDPEARANVRLIAAAPTLYAALDALLRGLHETRAPDYYDDALEAPARAALAKARGES